MKKFHISLPCFLLVALPTIATGDMLFTALQTKAFGADSSGASSGVNGQTLSAGISQPLAEFEKFDPTLGTLVSVHFTVDVNATYSINITSNSIIDANEPFSISINPGENFNVIQAGIGYAPTGDTLGYSITFDNAIYNGTSIVDEDPETHGGQNNFQFSRSEGESFGGFASDGQNPTVGSILVSAEFFNPNDFIGTGNVVGLNFDFNTQISTVGSLDNVTDAGLDLSISSAAGNATLQYEYIPASSTPPPTVTSYSKDGTNHTINFTGTVGITDWKVKGSSNLASFPNDHTLEASFNEISPGVYRCTLALPSLSTEPKYFFRIGRD